MDSLATALRVKTDDLLKDSPHLAPWRPAGGIAPQLTDAEPVTLLMMQAMPGFTSEAKWLRHARAHLRHLFRHLPRQRGYNKRLREAAELLLRGTRVLATDTSVRSDTCGSWTPRRWSADAPARRQAHNDHTSRPVLRSLTAYDH